MPLVVPQLDKQVFTPGQPRDYVSHALQIASMYPNYGKMMNDARTQEMQNQALQLKYQTDLQKAQQFLDLYPDYRDAQIAQLRAKANQANAMGPMYAAHAELYKSMASPQTDPAHVAALTGDPLPPIPGSAAAVAPPAPTAPPAPPALPPPSPPDSSSFDIGNINP